MLTRHFPRVFVCAVALLQILQAYPVAGSQLAFGTFLVIPTALCCLRDGLVELLPAPGRRELSHAALLIVVALTTSLYVRKRFFFTKLTCLMPPLPSGRRPTKTSADTGGSLQLHRAEARSNV